MLTLLILIARGSFYFAGDLADQKHLIVTASFCHRFERRLGYSVGKPLERTPSGKASSICASSSSVRRKSPA
jgi:hypothetical protein